MISEESVLSSTSTSIDSPDSQPFTFPFESLQFIRPIKKAKFSVYLVQSNITQELLAIKLFPLYQGHVLSYFWNEARFASLSHKNIIRIFHTEAQHTITKGIEAKIFSYILMEYAPYGDFLDLITEYKVPFDDKLVRTYFHQLIEGLEYMHKSEAAHMDIKPENLLLGWKIKANGTKDFRAPELRKNCCNDVRAADIFSAGVILFLLKSGGAKPFVEKTENDKFIDLYAILQENNEEFWKIHSQNKKTSEPYDEDFKNLFNAMTREDVESRAKIFEIKQSNWYKRDIYNDKELAQIMKQSLKA